MKQQDVGTRGHGPHGARGPPALVGGLCSTVKLVCWGAGRRGRAPAQDLAPEAWSAAVAQLSLVWGTSFLTLPEAAVPEAL